MRSARVLLAVAALASLGLADVARAQEGDPPPCLESDVYTIRVCAQRERDQEQAELLLLLAERCWELAVDQMGFSPPWRPGTEEGTVERGLLLQLVAEPGPGAQLLFDSGVDETPHADCAVHIQLNPDFPQGNRWMQFTHEFLLALQAADDCVEPLGEFFPPYLMLHLLAAASMGEPSENLGWMSQYFYGAFQANPHFSLDMYYPSLAELSNYHLGQGLFAMYLDERFGDGDGAVLGALSAAGRQDGVVEVTRGKPRLGDEQLNEPDLYDALDIVLADHGSGFWAAVEEFSVWRLLTGPFAAEGYLRYGALLHSVTIAQRYSVEELPALKEQPSAAPLETGSVYLNVEIGEQAAQLEGDRLVLDVSSGGGEGWYLAALVFDSEGEHRLLDGEHSGGTGRLVVDGLEGAQHVVLIITALGDRVHDPDDNDWDPIYFQYDLRLVEQPRVDAVRPQELRAGAQGAAVLVQGDGFGTGLQASLGDSLTIADLVVDEPRGQLVMVVNVPDDAPAGWHALTLSNELGLQARLEEGVRVVGGAAPEPLGLDPAVALPGTQLYVRLMGRQLQPGARIELPEPLGVTLLRADPVDEQEWVLELSVAEDAPPGARALTVTNPDGQSATVPGDFEVLAPPAPPAKPSDSGDDGCALAAPGTAPANALAATLAAAALALIVRWRAGRRP